MLQRPLRSITFGRLHHAVAHCYDVRFGYAAALVAASAEASSCMNITAVPRTLMLRLALFASYDSVEILVYYVVVLVPLASLEG